MMCYSQNRCGSARQSSCQSGSCGCGCGCQSGSCGCQSDIPTATISMADYQPYVLVPTTVFDQGDVDCACGMG